MLWNCQHVTQTLCAKLLAPLRHLLLLTLVTAWLIHHPMCLTLSDCGCAPCRAPAARPHTKIHGLNKCEDWTCNRSEHDIQCTQQEAWAVLVGNRKPKSKRNCVHSAAIWRDCPCKEPKKHMTDVGTDSNRNLMFRHVTSSRWIW